jgi:hypothetical protein
MKRRSFLTFKTHSCERSEPDLFFVNRDRQPLYCYLKLEAITTELFLDAWLYLTGGFYLN